MNVQFSGVEKYLCGYTSGVKQFLNPQAKKMDVLLDATTDGRSPDELVFGVTNNQPVMLAISNGHGVALDGQDVVELLKSQDVPGAAELRGLSAPEIEEQMTGGERPLAALFRFLIAVKQNPTDLVRQAFDYVRQALDTGRDAEGQPVKEFFVEDGGLVPKTQD